MPVSPSHAFVPCAVPVLPPSAAPPYAPLLLLALWALLFNLSVVVGRVILRKPIRASLVYVVVPIGALLWCAVLPRYWVIGVLALGLDPATYGLLALPFVRR